MLTELEECIELAKVVKENNVITTVCHELRYSVPYKKIKEILESKIIGKPVHFF